MAFQTQILKTETMNNPEMAIRWDDANSDAEIHFLESSQDRDGEIHVSPLLRLSFKEAAALAYMVANAGGSMAFRGGSIYVVPNHGRDVGSKDSLRIEIYDADDIWSKGVIAIDPDMVAPTLYEIVGL